MPWNDTAQLNYLIPEVREAVIQTILHVARQFPIIRFDAAMTLAKRHYHRLWFPAPGEGGDIPSRAGRGLTAEEFDAVMPQEFWREVVDRIAAEAPDTLLLAEAFWLMESYFVRTLGMHRVYNSAFMNMMRKEENAKYRQVLKNTLEFDPDILGRFVNFMNNPDEKTAVEQFGKGDKYFGICTLMATLPGLPMFGHGQVEGYGEKYGMEYPRAYWNEQPDAGLIGHHERVIFPLLHKRHLFAGSENFVLYDFWTGSGEVNENVFAFSNRSRGERALVLYNNHDAPASGWIKSSVGMVHKQPDGSKPLRQLDLGFALDLRHGPQDWVVFRDTTSGLEFLRKSEELHGRGLYFELGPYGYRSFLDWREVKDEHGQYARLAGYIGLGGVPNVEIAVKEMLFEPFHGPFRALADPELWRAILGIAPEPVLEEIPAAEVAPAEAPVPAAAPAYADPIAELETRYVAFLTSVRGFLHLEAAIDPILAATMRRVEAVAALPPCVPADVAKPADVPSAAIVPLALTDEARLTLLAWATVAEIGRLGGESGAPARSRAWVDDWLLDARLADCLAAAGVGPPAVTEGVAAVKILTAHAGSPATGPFPLLSALLADKQVQAILGVNRWDGVIWFRREGFEKLIQWLRQSESLTGHILPLDPLVDAARASGYRLVRLMEAARPAGVPAKSGNGAAQVAGPATAIAAPVSTLKPGV